MTSDIKVLEAVAEARRCLERDWWCEATTIEHKTVRLLLSALAAQSAELTSVKAEHARLVLELRDCRILSEGYRQNAEEHLRNRFSAEGRAIATGALLDKAVEAEREACARIADALLSTVRRDGTAAAYHGDIAAAIRARSTLSEIKEARR